MFFVYINLFVFCWIIYCVRINWGDFGWINIGSDVIVWIVGIDVRYMYWVNSYVGIYGYVGIKMVGIIVIFCVVVYIVGFFEIE